MLPNTKNKSNLLADRMHAFLKTLQQDKKLSDLSTFGIGGTARYFLTVRTQEELQKAILNCNQANYPYLIIGKGSNCLFDSKGFDGLVILNKIDFMHQLGPGIFHVGAGYSFSLLGAQTARQGWSGLEFASGIPGSVGGAVFMNAGANGKETAETLVSVDYVTADGELKTLKKEELHFAYRSSSFQSLSGGISGAVFKLIPSETARQKQLEIISYRTKTQPYSEMSAGCIFRNPDCGHAGALIDQCGLKGMQVGDAQVSHVHANFIVNKSQASSDDVLSLIALIQKKVRETTGKTLESEVRYIPFKRPLHD